ncbi:unnamed protein product, partial [Allacma fusca]
SGYVEDGREIFDEDMEDAEEAARRKRKVRHSKRDKDDAQMSKESNPANFQSVRDILSNMPQKRKRAKMTSSAGPSVDQETLLSDLMLELKNDTKTGPSTSTEKLIKKIATPQLEPLKMEPKKAPSVVIKPGLNFFTPPVSYANKKTEYSRPSTSTYQFSKQTENSSANLFVNLDDDFNDSLDFEEPLELPREPQSGRRTNSTSKVMSDFQRNVLSTPVTDADVVIKTELGVPIKAEHVEED